MKYAEDDKEAVMATGHRQVDYTGGGIDTTLVERDTRQIGGSVPCTACGEPTIDTQRRIHDHCRQRPPVTDWPFPARDYAVAAAPKPHPAPEVVARPAQQGEVPRGAQQVIKKVAEPWSVAETLYYRGTKLTMRGPGAVVDGCCVKLTRPGAAAVAIWTDGKFDTAMYVERGSLRTITATNLKKLVAGDL